MFYSQVILARKGPLGKIWIAAHFDKKLTKSQIFSTNIEESVESVINPSAPLALRVSGQLMLGIVRIYSRKVKYLMNDCTEAMWKIKLAFRPGNVDLMVDAQSASANAIDDPRYFGNVQPDPDFPELADTAFSQNLLTNYDNLKAARGRTIAALRDTTEEEYRFGVEGSFVGTERMRSLYMSPARGEGNLVDIPGVIPGETWLRSESSKGSRVSDIEMMRGERSRTSLSVARTSMSSMGGGMAMHFEEDDIPAFEEHPDEGAGVFGEEYVPTLDDYYTDAYGEPGPREETLGAEEEVHGAEEAKEVMEERIKPQTEAREKLEKKKVSKRALRKVTVIDNRVELGTKTIKERMNEIGPTLRRRVDDPLSKRPRPGAELSIEERLAQPSVRGLCPELRALFAMTMTTGPLPFPLLRQRGDEREEGLEEEKYGGEGDIEITRGAGVQESGRPSFLGAPQGGEWEEQEATYYNQGDFGYEELPAFEAGLAGVSDTSALGIRMEQAVGLDDVTLGMETTQPPEKVLSGAPTPVFMKAPDSWNARTALVLEVLQDQLRDKDEVTFDEISAGITRKTASACFLEILQLKTWGLLSAYQDKPFSDIHIRATPHTFEVR